VDSRALFLDCSNTPVSHVLAMPHEQKLDQLLPAEQIQSIPCIVSAQTRLQSGWSNAKLHLLLPTEGMQCKAWAQAVEQAGRLCSLAWQQLREQGLVKACRNLTDLLPPAERMQSRA